MAASSYFYVNHGPDAVAARWQDEFRKSSDRHSKSPSVRAFKDFLNGVLVGCHNAPEVYIGVSGAELVQAQGTLTYTGQPSASDTVTIGSTTLTADTDYTIGGDADTTYANFVTAVAANAALNAVVSATQDTGAGTVVITVRVPGEVGNHVVFTESSSNATIDGSGSLGGTTAGAGAADTAPVSFSFGDEQ